ncbi:meiosis-specific protein ASY2-like isoform X2 [Raphanus sativus]|uniref:Meiosis-specific protein ASY2-like isoform X2 n=1 Tax=Raphanus sativus TaxID=3726 RepID=A0A9W3DJ65_RAPSA|nr:meiosis-specific protein ASY2-like isoform X2 [Raphanus sativus]
MKQTPDLSAILKGQLKLLSKRKSASVVDGEPADVVSDDPPPSATPGATEDSSAAAGTETREEGKGDSPEDMQGSVRAEGERSEAPDGAVQQKSSKKKKGKKRSREASSKKETEDSNASREGPAEASANDPSEEHPKKQRKKPTEAEQSSCRQVDPLTEDATLDDAVDGFARDEREREEFTPVPGASISKYEKASGKRAVKSRSAPSLSEGADGSFAARRSQMNFPDVVDFSYNGDTLLISNPMKCAELTRQVRGGPVALPPVENLFFKEDYVEAAHARKVSEGVTNRMVEKYETELRRTQAQLGVSENSARAAEAEVARVRRMHEIATAKAVEDKEILRVKFENLKTKLLNSRSAVKILTREKASLEKERDAVVDKLISERKRLRDSRVYEVTLERARVETAMAVKAQRRFDNIRDYSVRRDEFEEAHNLFGQASGTRKSLEAAKDEGFDVGQELIDLYKTQEELYKAKMDELWIGDIPESDLSLSPLVLPSTFVSQEVLAGLDKYGTNDSFLDPGTVVRMQSPDDSFDIMMKERSKGPGVAEQGKNEEPIAVQETPAGKEEAKNGEEASVSVGPSVAIADLAGPQDLAGHGKDPAC